MNTKSKYEAPKVQKAGAASDLVQGSDATGSDYLDEFLIPGGPFLTDQE